MASYSATVPSSRAQDEVFTYLADFRSVAEWDPSITSSTHTSDGQPIQVGARFEVVTSVLGHETALTYETVELERPGKIVLRGENDACVSIDTITIAPSGTGCEVTYDAEIELKGVRKVADPLMGVALGRLGAKAKDGLREQLNP
ncbi:MAG: Polyketide cyclase / dehydrase and lipid transport [Solirubrobacterales bacterium]|nr:Polyketide cyclase / dehydrase and lipid transport [Solirubrobacterales bacterium]